MYFNTFILLNMLSYHSVHFRIQNFLVSLKKKKLILEQICQNDSLWNVQLRLNTASAEEDQRLFQHHCLFSPAQRFYITACLAPPNDSTSLPV